MNLKLKINTILIFFILSGCDSSDSYFPLKKSSILHYNILSTTDGFSKTKSKQTYTVIDVRGNRSVVLGNSGQVISYLFEKDGIKREDINYIDMEYIINFDGSLKIYKNFDLPSEKLDNERDHYVIKFPLEIGTSWSIEDMTRLKMTIGYDRVFETWLPFKLTNKIVSKNERVRIKNKIYKNCIKVVGKGNTSYNAGPPIGVINITIENIDWYAPGIGLVKTVRSERSDSETMGELFTEKYYEENEI